MAPVALARCYNDSGSVTSTTVVLNLNNIGFTTQSITTPVVLTNGTMHCDYEGLGLMRDNKITFMPGYAGSRDNKSIYIQYPNYLLRFQITSIAPGDKSYGGFGGKNFTAADAASGRNYTYEVNLVKTAPTDGSTIIKAGNSESVTIDEAILATDTSGISWPGWVPGKWTAEIIAQIWNLIMGDPTKKIFSQTIVINYHPRVTTCSIPDTLVALPEIDRLSISQANGGTQYGKSFTLQAQCSELLNGATTRAIQFYLSSAYVNADNYTLENSQGSAKNVGVRIIRTDTSKNVAISPTMLAVSAIKGDYEMFKAAAWSTNLTIPLRAYYYAYGKNIGNGLVRTAAQVNIVYP